LLGFLIFILIAADIIVITVFGGSGFIGTRLCKILDSMGLEFFVLDKVRSPYFGDKTIITDIREVEKLRTAMPLTSVIVNLAAEHRDDVMPRSLYDEVNVNGSINICNAARERQINKIIFVSSVAIYGFAEPNTDESGEIKYFNDYGRTKWMAENVFREWQREDPTSRCLTIIRPTVVFGEQNRGNVYNLLRQIYLNRFLMIGAGNNFKSMAYVENVASFIVRAFDFGPGVHAYNYVDKPDMNMNDFISTVRAMMGRGHGVGIRVPYPLGLICGYLFDVLSKISGKSFPISSIRVRKFCGTTQFNSAITPDLFVPPVSLIDGLQRTIVHDFMGDSDDETVFMSE
jgi:nucleoside-diphosphate-sugar epimerase